jgi:D-alanine-D-alanine ligase
MRGADREPLEEAIRAVVTLGEEEVAGALALLAPGDEQRRIVVAEVEREEVVGFASYSPTPLTDGVFDLCALIVHPDFQERGIGRTLLQTVEESVRLEGGRMILAEVASRASQSATRAFYIHGELEEVARIPDFYAMGDDKVVYTKRL